jgi:outer membrane receptor protein involved in Fe transport
MNRHRTDTYSALARNNAFAMFDNNHKLIWGLRAEFFEQFLETTDLSLKQVIINTEKWDFLPSVNFTYAFNTKNQLRAAASRTLSRPEFREIAPFQFFDYEQIWGISGNPGLERTSIINLDLRYEYYQSPVK